MATTEAQSRITKEQSQLLKAVQVELLGRAQDAIRTVKGSQQDLNHLLCDINGINRLLSAQLEARERGEGIAGLRRKVGKDYRKSMVDKLVSSDGGDLSFAKRVLQFAFAMEDAVACDNPDILAMDNNAENCKVLANVFFGRASEKTDDYIAREAEKKESPRRSR